MSDRTNSFAAAAVVNQAPAVKFAFLSSYAHRALQRQPTGVSGGAELQVALLAKELVTRGHEVVIIAAADRQPTCEMLDGVLIRVGGAYQTGAVFDTLLSVPRVFNVLRHERPDVVGIMGAGTWVYFLHLFKKLLGYRLIFIAGSDIDVDGSYRAMNRIKGRLYEAALSRADVRFAMTSDQQQQCQKRGLSCALYRNLLPAQVLEASKKTVDFLWVSSAQKLKQPVLFLELAEKFPQHSFLMICPLKHDLRLWKSIRNRAEKIANLRFHEWIAYDRVQQFFGAAQVFVNTSTYEGFPNSFVQAGLGRAAILSLQVDPDAFITRYGAGVCASGDLEKFWNAARTMMSDSEALKRMQQQAARYVHDFHDNSRNVAAFLEGIA